MFWIGITESDLETLDGLKWQSTGNPVKIFSPATLQLGRAGENCFKFETSDNSIRDEACTTRLWSICGRGCMPAGVYTVFRKKCY